MFQVARGLSCTARGLSCTVILPARTKTNALDSLKVGLARSKVVGHSQWSYRAQEQLEPGYRSLITPPLRDLAGIYALTLERRRTLVHHAYIRARSLEEVL